MIVADNVLFVSSRNPSKIVR